jgi:TRAP-type C4-dicarboxylate transport system permease small subunit
MSMSNYPTPPRFEHAKRSSGIDPMRIIHVLGCLAGMGFCGLAGLYSLAVWANIMNGDQSPLAVSMAGPYVTATVIAGVGFFIFVERLLAGFHER